MNILLRMVFVTALIMISGHPALAQTAELGSRGGYLESSSPWCPWWMPVCAATPW